MQGIAIKVIKESRLFCSGFEAHCGRIHAVAQARGFWAIFKNMAQMGVAFSTKHFGADAEKRTIGFQGDIVLGDGLKKAGPTGA